MNKHQILLQKFAAKFLLFAGVSLGFILLFANCNKKSTEPENMTFPDSNLSFQQHIHPIFLHDCVSSGCHENGQPAAGLDLETLTPTFTSGNNRIVVFPNDPDQSILYRVLLGNYLGISQMPKNRLQLSDAKIKAIRTWIQEGAYINN